MPAKRGHAENVDSGCRFRSRRKDSKPCSGKSREIQNRRIGPHSRNRQFGNFHPPHRRNRPVKGYSHQLTINTRHQTERDAQMRTTIIYRGVVRNSHGEKVAIAKLTFPRVDLERPRLSHL